MLPHKIALALALFAPVLVPVLAKQARAQSPERTPATRHAPESFERIAELYAAPATDTTGLDGGVVIFDVEGLPVVGARVAVLHSSNRNAEPEVLECVTSDATGRVQLETRSRATTLAIWDHVHPPRKVAAGRLDRHRELAGQGAFLVELGNPEVVAGYVQLDGKPAPEGFELTLGIGPGTTTLLGFDFYELKALAPFDGPSEPLQTTTDANGNFHIEGLRFPRVSSARVRPLNLTWSAPEVFRVLHPDSVYPNGTSLYERRMLPIDGPRQGVEVALETGRWVTGQIIDPMGRPLARSARLIFTAPGSTKDDEDVYVQGESKTFQFAIPRDATELDLKVDAGQPKPLVATHFDAPADSLDWPLGEVNVIAPNSVLLTVLGPQGEPIKAAAARWCDADGRDLASAPGERPLAPNTIWPGSTRTSLAGRTMIQRPPSGQGLIVTRAGFEPRAIFAFPASATKELIVRLEKSPELRLETTFPAGFPGARLLVQLEAPKPALRLHRGLAQSRVEEAARACSAWLPGLALDERSLAPWSHTQPFFPAAPWPPVVNAEPAQVDCQIQDLIPGVPLHVRVLDPTGSVFLDTNIKAFSPGESRTLQFEVGQSNTPVRGRVLDKAGQPVKGVTISFGKLVLAPVATTDDEGRFTIDSPFATSGPLMVARTITYTSCDFGKSPSYHSSMALLLDNNFQFDPSGETLIELPGTTDLNVRLVDTQGMPFDGWHRTHCESIDGKTILAVGTRAVPGASEFSLPRPRGVTVKVVAEVEGRHFQATAPATTDQVTIVVPRPGNLSVPPLTGFVPDGFNNSASFRLVPQDGGPTTWRSVLVNNGEPIALNYLLGGTYSMQLFRADYRGNALQPLGRSITVTVHPGETTEAQYSL